MYSFHMIFSYKTHRIYETFIIPMKSMFYETHVGNLSFETDDENKWHTIISPKRIYDIAMVIFLIERSSTIIRFSIQIKIAFINFWYRTTSWAFSDALFATITLFMRWYVHSAVSRSVQRASLAGWEITTILATVRIVACHWATAKWSSVTGWTRDLADLRICGLQWSRKSPSARKWGIRKKKLTCSA